ncbi:protein-glutamate methylesterase/protein-glutamine glutaminase [Acidocella aminolytica]|jgi:two-component system chemotaxis response regulator CheB|uniref:Protein-glutamate methylesterase/protein-glutamine glutaminase n=1 Tax=Acidocella aminolytica 101 = DSM 11237 TaxID=1120923 RepID=A0A0D6PBN3_9PROT|nr:chemotaxis response regulator protein-glutamate methylesterase [Acidocella aminolytica]GAN79092.1 response regulator receiver modulated CheB methylesterase [Acidocella aminolytica 101 = DSM 11237]GBQ39986.1 chemotaxis response regulator [Acidocella aminolytica 101 = DSM 11237]SHF14365.1 two-component system, chemotaxis family, response regulator CheB [Acidocella aminolytica 101 = DSM 11237]
MLQSKKRVRVLIVDDSASVRQTLAEVLASDPEIDVLGIASDPFVAATRIRDQVPDVITLDVEMPRMDGITFLRKLMAQHPIPVVMCSSLVESGSETLMQALEAGAVDIILKPRIGVSDQLTEAREHICDVVKGAAQARVGRRRDRNSYAFPSIESNKKLTADAMLPPAVVGAMARTTETIVCIGASTGGTESLREVLEALPSDAPGIVIVQHMPEKFTASFARRLDSLCEMEVKEAKNGDGVLRGRVLIAPGNLHTMIERSGARYYVSVKDGPLIARHRPSVDVLFRSAARAAGSNAVGVIMTGMGDDGARGLTEMKNAGAFTLAQDEATSIVFGMPKEAIARGGVDRIVPLHHLAQEIRRAAAR